VPFAVYPAAVGLALVHVVVVGGGVSGLGAALVLARRGHQITVVERDDTPMPASADEAFDWDRRGAPQVRHSHAFLARLVGMLRRDYPDVYAELLREGATEMRFGDDMPPAITNFELQPDDAELVMLACRRTTFEWVLRRAAIAEGTVTLRTGVGVSGLVADRGDALPNVTGVRLADGSEIAADFTVVAAGRRSALSEWLNEIGVAAVPEVVDETGIVYLSRFYRLREGESAPPRSGPIGGDLGYLKYGVFAGDNRTFSVTLATPTADEELRKLVTDPFVFDTCARQLIATQQWLDGRAVAIDDGVHVMAGLINRWRQHVVDDVPVATGVAAVGDAVLCTNPLYGRGCSTAFWSAHLLADSMAAHANDPIVLQLSYDASLRAEILPWYRSSVDQDKESNRVANALLAGEDPDGDPNDPRAFIRSVLRDGLMPAMRRDAIVLRAFFRTFNLLCAPDAMVQDQDVFGRVLAIWQDRANREPEPLLGPATRTELLAALAS